METYCQCSQIKQARSSYSINDCDLQHSSEPHVECEGLRVPVLALSPGPFPTFQCCTLFSVQHWIWKLGNLGLGTRLYQYNVWRYCIWGPRKKVQGCAHNTQYNSGAHERKCMFYEPHFSNNYWHIPFNNYCLHHWSWYYTEEHRFSNAD